MPNDLQIICFFQLHITDCTTDKFKFENNTDYIALVNLPSRSAVGNDISGSLGTAVGWGLDSDSSNTISSVLRYVQTDVITNLLCNVFYFGLIQDTNVCIDGSEGKSTCSGDSGGPLLVENTQVTFMIFNICIVTRNDFFPRHRFFFL